jgi:hypothetical protein
LIGPAWPGAPHNIGHRPSNMIDQILHIIGWFDRYDSEFR